MAMTMENFYFWQRGLLRKYEQEIRKAHILKSTFLICSAAIYRQCARVLIFSKVICLYIAVS